jgi:uncharacterized protein (DUF486 family)
MQNIGSQGLDYIPKLVSAESQYRTGETWKILQAEKNINKTARAAIFSSFSALYIQNSTPLNKEISVACIAFKTRDANR